MGAALVRIAEERGAWDRRAVRAMASVAGQGPIAVGLPADAPADTPAPVPLDEAEHALDMALDGGLGPRAAAPLAPLRPLPSRRGQRHR